MCLSDEMNDSQSRARALRRLALTAILLASVSLLIGMLHPRPGPDADFFDFLRGLVLGIGMMFIAAALMPCLRRPSNQ